MIIISFSPKVISELVEALYGFSYSNKLISRLESVRNLRILKVVSETLAFHLKSLDIDSIELPLLLRSVEIFGKFLVRR